MGCYALAAMKDLDRQAGDAHVYLLMDQGVRHRAEELVDLDVVVDVDSRELPDGKLVVARW